MQVDELEERQHILGPVCAFSGVVEDFAGGDVHRREQVGGAVALVVMGHRPGPPGFIGNDGWVRSNAWHWVFSSKLNTTARSGGFRYSPTTSTSLASKSGSFEILNVSTFHGLS